MSLALDQPPPRFHPLAFLEEAGDFVVGRTDVDRYVVLPPDGAALLRELQAGRPPAQAAEWYRDRYGEPVDVDGFLAELRELGFVRDGDESDTEAPAPPVRGQALGRALFSPLAWAAYVALVVGAVAACVVAPGLAPRRDHVFFTDHLVLVEVTVLVGQLVLTLVHELFHVLAGRRLGLRATVRLSQRFYFVVWETALDGLVLVPRRRRWLPMLAGLLADLLAVAALTVAAFLTRQPDGSVSLVGGVCLALAFTTLPRMAWQFYFFLRTDIYHLVVTLLSCRDLHGAARALLRNWVNRRLGRHDRLVDEEAWHPRDRRAARWYAPLMVGGYAASLAMLAVVVLPLSWEFLSTAAGRAFLGDAGDAAAVWDAALLLALTAAQLVLALTLAIRSRRNAV